MNGKRLEKAGILKNLRSIYSEDDGMCVGMWRMKLVLRKILKDENDSL